MSILRREHILYIIGTRVTALLAILTIVGCTSDDAALSEPIPEPTPADGKVAVDLALSLSTAPATTRMASNLVNPTSLSGLDFSIIPFSIPDSQDTISSGNLSLAEAITNFSVEGNHYLSNQVELSIGTNAFLCYAKVNQTDPYSKADNGSLIVSGTGLSSQFKLEPLMQTPSAPNADAVKLLGYMNDIATAGDWHESTDEEQAKLFNSFVNINGTPQPIAGSSRNIIAYINYWYDKAQTIADPLGNAIRTKIAEYFTVDAGKVTAIKDISRYPVDLPDGNAVMTWNNTSKRFEYKEIQYNQTSGEYAYVADEDRFLDYVYPAERYFYANSRIKTSTSSQKSHYTEARWSEKEESTDADGVLDYYSDDNAIVASTTRSVAIKNPLSYGVAGMEIHFKAEVATDANGNYLRDDDTQHDNYADSRVALGATSFPLTAIIVGSQVEQKYCFEPRFPDDKTEKEYLIYDTKVQAVKTTGDNPQDICLGETYSDSYPVYTLGLQTKDGLSTKVVLEFLNNSQDFISENGIIYKGTKFYMVASVVPPSSDGIGKRVMTRGHMSVINLTIKSLKSAYNALPNLNSDNLRLFDIVEAGIKKWQPGQEGEHEVFNW